MDTILEIEHYNFESLFSEEIFLKKAVFNVPRYQREYNWSVENYNDNGKREVNDFWDDIIEHLKNDKPDYFGSILLYRNQDLITKYEIVDGQQRIITALLLYKAMGASLNKELLPLFLSSDREGKILEKILLDEELDAAEKRCNIARTYYFFDDKLQHENRANLLKSFKKIQISIAIVEDEFEGNLLFGRLNTRGLPLSDVDLIKYEIFREFNRCSGRSGNDTPLSVWKNIQTILYNDVDTQLDIDKFILYWWNIKNPTIPFSFENFKELYRAQDYIESFLLPIFRSVEKIQHYILNNTGSDNGIADNIKWLFAFKIFNRDSGADIALLKILLSDNLDNRDKKILIDILTLAESMQYALEVREVGYKFGNLQKYYKSALLIDGEGAILDKLCNNIKKDISSNQIKEEIVSTLSNLRYSSSQTRFTYGSKYEEKNLIKYTLFRLANTIHSNNISVEHIIDKSEGKGDENSPCFKLGNLVLLEKSINNSLPKELRMKIVEYEKSEIKQMKDFLYRKKRQSSGWKVDKHNSWDPNKFSEEHINSRGKYLATLLLNELMHYIIDYNERQK